ncbi:MAG: exodeoxyribonuclease V subunit alpha, partial [Deltaproteobacteria bacterium]|nr:exodeoxyribonuclease V subunit alpha [Deltaproteobacteria bacterium]
MAALEPAAEAALASLRDLDRQFADFVLSLGGSQDPAVWLGAALASHATQAGHTCLDLREVAGRAWALDEEDEGLAAGRAPALEPWLEALRRSDAVGEPGAFRPLILTAAGRLYLHRYFEYERRLAESLRSRTAGPAVALDRKVLARTWKAIENEVPLAPAQRRAAEAALELPLAVISGGAGTGKTTVVACVLRLLAAQPKKGPPLRVRLAAPTGKAANRLKEQIRDYRGRIDPEGAIEAVLREEPATLHRLLGGAPGLSRFRHHAANPLAVDVLIVDETSMVDLALMARVVDALPAHARLVLIGDEDQLPPVEVGSVFGEICAGLPGATIRLDRSWRFREESGIGALAESVRSGQPARRPAEPIDSSEPVAASPEDLAWIEPGPRDEPSDAMLARVDEGLAAYLEAVRAGGSPEEILKAFQRFRVLCVRRDGAAGVVTLNEAIETRLRRRGRLESGSGWYAGRPVMVTRNDYGLRLWNGEVGVTLRGEDGALEVHFEGNGGETRRFAPGRLTHVETAFALTVHKSQGSEFEDVLLVLPSTPSRLMTRELLYTAVTRARARLAIVGS